MSERNAEIAEAIRKLTKFKENVELRDTVMAELLRDWADELDKGWGNFHQIAVGMRTVADDIDRE